MRKGVYVNFIVTGSWTGITAGGCANHPTTYPHNPKYTLVLGDSRAGNNILLDLKGPKEYQLGIEVKVESMDDPSITAPFVQKSSGAYRSGFVALEMYNLPAGKYIITVSTFYPAQEGPFILTVKSTSSVQLN